MKAVLISIRPKYSGMIFAKRKSREIRKTSPNLKPPFRCYVYECGNGVVGEFICQDIAKISKVGFTNLQQPPMYPIYSTFLAECCLSHQELEDYMQGRVIHAWRIAEPKKYSSPRPVSDFYSYDKYRGLMPIMRPPQSWCYVEEIE